MGLDIYFNKRNKARKEIAYFRKVNFLVKYVDEVLGREVDNCRDVVLEKEDIEELVRRCGTVIDSLKNSKKKEVQYETGWCNGETTYATKKVFTGTKVAEELLPTMNGFFFGSTDYDEDYLDNVKQVKEDMERILKEVDFDTEEVVFYISY